MKKTFEVIFSKAEHPWEKDQFIATDAVSRESHSGTSLLKALFGFIKKEQAIETAKSTLSPKRQLFDESLTIIKEADITKAEKKTFHLYRFYWETPQCPGEYVTEPLKTDTLSLEKEIVHSHMNDTILVTADLTYEVGYFEAPKTKKDWVRTIYNHFHFKDDAEKYLASHPWTK